MTTTHAPQPDVSRNRLANVPIAFWIGLGLFGAGFVVQVSAYSMSSGSLGSSCSYVDLGALFFAAGMVTCAVVGWATNYGRLPWRRLPVPAMTLFSVALVALSAVHVLRGLGTVGGPCR